MNLARLTAPRTARLVAIVVAGVVLLAGLAYAFGRPAEFQSSALLVLTPATTNAEEATNIIESIERSGTIGTHVELLASDDTLARAGDPPVSVVVRAIPDSRVIEVSTQGDEAAVRPALGRVIEAASSLESELRDPWSQRVLQRPSAPTQVGPSTVYVLLASIVLALLAALAVVVVLRRVGGDDEGDAAPDPWDRGVTAEVVPRPRDSALR